MKKRIISLLIIGLIIGGTALGDGGKPEDVGKPEKTVENNQSDKKEEVKDKVEEKKEELETKKEEIKDKVETKKEEIEEIKEKKLKEKEVIQEQYEKEKEELDALKEKLKTATEAEKEQLELQIQALEAKVKNSVTEMVKLRNEIRTEIRNSYTEEELNQLKASFEALQKQYEGIKLLDIDKLISKSTNFKFDNPPVIKDGNTLIPLRALSEGFKAEVNYDESAKTVTIIKAETTIVLTLGESTATVNGKTVELGVEAELLNNSTYVPLRFIAEALGLEVEWNQEDGTIELDETENPAPGETTTSGAIETTTENAIIIEVK